MIAHRTSNCGVADLDQLSRHTDPAEALRTLSKEFKYGPFGHVAFAMFTGVVRLKGNHGLSNIMHAGGFRQDNYGAAFAAFLLKEGLGTITAPTPVENPASGNDLGVWIWTINRPALTRWFAENAQP